MKHCVSGKPDHNGYALTLIMSFQQVVYAGDRRSFFMLQGRFGPAVLDQPTPATTPPTPRTLKANQVHRPRPSSPPAMSR